MKTGKYANWVILNQKPIHVANLSVVCASKMPIRPILKTYLDSCDDRNVEIVHEAFYKEENILWTNGHREKGLQENSNQIEGKFKVKRCVLGSDIALCLLYASHFIKNQMFQMKTLAFGEI